MKENTGVEKEPLGVRGGERETERDFSKTNTNIKLSWPLGRNFSLVFLCRIISEKEHSPNVESERERESEKGGFL